MCGICGIAGERAEAAEPMLERMVAALRHRRPDASGRRGAGEGPGAHRHYDWAVLEVTSDDAPDGHEDGHSVLLVRRHRYTGTLSYYRCWTPGPVPLSWLIAIAVARWRIEEDHKTTQQSTGLAAGRVICW